MSMMDGCVLHVCSGAKVRLGSLADGADQPASAAGIVQGPLAMATTASDLTPRPVARAGDPGRHGGRVPWDDLQLARRGRARGRG